MIYVDALVQHLPPKDAVTRRAGAPHGHRWCHLMCDPGEGGRPSRIRRTHRSEAVLVSGAPEGERSTL